MTHTLAKTREILKQIQAGMGPLPPGFDLETLICQTVSAVAEDNLEYLFVVEPPRQALHVQGEVADLIQALSGVLHALMRLAPGGTHVNIWTFNQIVDGRRWVAIRMRENTKGLWRDGEQIKRAMDAMTCFVKSIGANLEVAWDSDGAAELSLWLPGFKLVDPLDVALGENAS